MKRYFSCIDCGTTYDDITSVRFACDCGGLLDLVQPLEELKKLDLKKIFDDRLSAHDLPDASGVWRFRELLFDAPENKIISRFEGNTRLYPAKKLSDELGIELRFKHEGENPTGSFKDRGLNVAMTAGYIAGAEKFVCASTGNTSAGLASYAASRGLTGIVIIPEGKISYSKLSQAMAYGAKVLQIQGDFDVAMKLVQEIAENFEKTGIYVLNSLNPFRVEGQKTIVFEILQQLHWRAPDWIVAPGGNLGNTSAFGKAISEAYELGLIDKKPRLAIIQAEGANPFYAAYKAGFPTSHEPVTADTIATAIKIGNPVSYPRAVRSITETDGVVEQVTDTEIMDAKAAIDGCGIGCEPASATTLAGIRRLRADGTIQDGEQVIGILTGHILKDPDATTGYHLGQLDGIESAHANKPQSVEASLEAVIAAI